MSLALWIRWLEARSKKERAELARELNANAEPGEVTVTVRGMLCRVLAVDDAGGRRAHVQPVDSADSPFWVAGIRCS